MGWRVRRAASCWCPIVGPCRGVYMTPRAQCRCLVPTYMYGGWPVLAACTKSQSGPRQELRYLDGEFRLDRLGTTWLLIARQVRWLGTDWFRRENSMRMVPRGNVEIPAYGHRNGNSIYMWTLPARQSTEPRRMGIPNHAQSDLMSCQCLCVATLLHVGSGINLPCGEMVSDDASSPRQDGVR